MSSDIVFPAAYSTGSSTDSGVDVNFSHCSGMPVNSEQNTVSRGMPDQVLTPTNIRGILSHYYY